MTRERSTKPVSDAAFSEAMLRQLSETPTELPDTPISIEWPKNVWVIKYSTGPHAVAIYREVHGLAVFKQKDHLQAFVRLVVNPPSRSWKAERIAWEDAEEIAREKGKPITSMILVAPHDTRIHLLR